MLIDSRGFPVNHQLDVDLCVIGAGPAGIAIARQFLGTDVRVCVLESGGLHVQRRAQRLSRGQSVGYPSYTLHSARVRAFGGTSRHWPLAAGWRARPLDPIDFERRPHVPHSGWPFQRSELEPYYVQAQLLCQLGPFDYDPVRWEDAEARRMPLPDSCVHTTVFQLGSTTFEGYRAEFARSRNVTVVLHATAAELATDGEPSRVDRVEVRRDDGSRWSVSARTVVLAAGGIENARLLLLSRRTHTRGLGNEHDLVGRFFSERLSARTGYVLPTRPDVDRQAAFYEDRVVGGTRVQGTLRIDDAVQTQRGLLNTTFFVLLRTRALTSEAVRSSATLAKGAIRQPRPPQALHHVRNVLGDLRALAALAGQRVWRRDGSEGVLVLRVQAEQAPHRESRVTLGDARDALGLRVPRLDWRISDSDRDSIRACQEILGQEMSAAGLGQVSFLLGDEDPPALFEGNRHHMGTTRMHDDPKHGVVDGSGRVHGVSNLYVSGSSVFPTYGCSNPTLTIVALALRLGAHLKQRLAQEVRV